MSRSVLLDTNLLVLLVAGLAVPDQIAQHKRLRRYSLQAFALLMARLQDADAVFVTPNVLTETSNLLPSGSDAMRYRLMTALRDLIHNVDLANLHARRTEHHVPSMHGAAHPAFVRLGLTDTTLLDSTLVGITLLTDDLPLYLEASKAGRAVEYFTDSLKEAGLL